MPVLKSKSILVADMKKTIVTNSIKVSLNSSNCSANSQFFATPVDTRGGGAFIVLPHTIPRVPDDYPLVIGHEGAVLDVAFCPSDDFKIASASEDKKVRVWQIPSDGFKAPMKTPLYKLVHHKLRVYMVVWHTTQSNTLLSAGADKKVLVWDVGSCEVKFQIEGHEDILNSACFNSLGTRLLTTCKDKKLRLFELFSRECIASATVHNSVQKTSAIFLGEDKIFTTGFDCDAKRQYSVRGAVDLNNGIVEMYPYTEHGLLQPFFEPRFNVLFLCGRGECRMDCFEVTCNAPCLRQIKSIRFANPQRGVCMLPPLGYSSKNCEIAKIYRLDNTGSAEIISLTTSKRSYRFLSPEWMFCIILAIFTCSVFIIEHILQ